MVSPLRNRTHLIDPIPETSPQGINKKGGLIPHHFDDDTSATRPSSREPILGTPVPDVETLITVYTSSESEEDMNGELLLMITGHN